MFQEPRHVVRLGYDRFTCVSPLLIPYMCDGTFLHSTTAIDRSEGIGPGGRQRSSQREIQSKQPVVLFDVLIHPIEYSNSNISNNFYNLLINGDDDYLSTISTYPHTYTYPLCIIYVSYTTIILHPAYRPYLPITVYMIPHRTERSS